MCSGVKLSGFGILGCRVFGSREVFGLGFMSWGGLCFRFQVGEESSKIDEGLGG